MSLTRVLIFKNGEDVSDACRMVNGKANPFGWSASELAHHNHIIGEVYCGHPKLYEEAQALGYTMTVTVEEEDDGSPPAD